MKLGWPEARAMRKKTFSNFSVKVVGEKSGEDSLSQTFRKDQNGQKDTLMGTDEKNLWDQLKDSQIKSPT